MLLDLDTYRDKVLGCWTGKNIGGVLGAPFEGYRQYNEIDFYTQDLSAGPPPNDDLDLQIIWLAAVERYGRNVTASILGEYWLSYCIPNWVEYGTGKANLRAGLVPPMSGAVENPYKDSDGCFIRSELWACLAPGHPEIAARYAYEDAIVDHAGEGMYGEVFFAALQSAAFVESDKDVLLDIALSYIPENGALYRAVQEARACHREGVDFKEARRRVHNTAPGTFGIQLWKLSEIKQEGNEGMEIGAPGFDAPENVAFAILAWLYGDGDLGKSLCLAVACGEDTDCTAASLGATLGILLGAKALPEKWTSPLCGRISTCCIDKTSRGVFVPETVEALTERVIRVMPAFLGQDVCDIFAEGGMTVACKEGNALYCAESGDYLPNINGNGKELEPNLRQLAALPPYVVRYACPAFSVYIDYCESAFFVRGEPRRLRVKVINSFTMHQQQWARITCYLPDGVELLSAPSYELPLNYNWGACAEAEFVFADNGGFTGSKLECILDVSLAARHSDGAFKVVLLRKRADERVAAAR